MNKAFNDEIEKHTYGGINPKTHTKIIRIEINFPVKTHKTLHTIKRKKTPKMKGNVIKNWK